MEVAVAVAAVAEEVEVVEVAAEEPEAAELLHPNPTWNPRCKQRPP